MMNNSSNKSIDPQITLVHKNESEITIKDITRGQWNALITSVLGWALDIMDLMVYSMVIVQIMAEFGFDTGKSGLLASSALVASAAGGIAFGFISDKVGRIKALTFSIIVYSIATLMCGLSTSFAMLFIFRILVGFGMGGEYGSGAALVTEIWPAKYRARIMAVVQSGFTLGYWTAAGLAAFLVPRFGWRSVFFVGVLPALLVFWIREHTPESPMWKEEQAKREAEKKKYSAKESISLMFSKAYIHKTISSLFFITFIQLGYWSINLWGPGFLSLPVEQGGRGMSIVGTSLWIVLMYCGTFIGYFVFGWIFDRIGAKKTYVFFIAGNIISIPIFLLATNQTLLLIICPIMGFFFALYAGFGPILTEFFPTNIRAMATGFIYNVSRAASGIAPTVIGVLAVKYGMDKALLLSAVFWICAMVFLFTLPPITGKSLD